MQLIHVLINRFDLLLSLTKIHLWKISNSRSYKRNVIKSEEASTIDYYSTNLEYEAYFDWIKPLYLDGRIWVTTSLQADEYQSPKWTRCAVEYVDTSMHQQSSCSINFRMFWTHGMTYSIDTDFSIWSSVLQPLLGAREVNYAINNCMADMNSLRSKFLG